jgi:hypothetical protein
MIKFDVENKKLIFKNWSLNEVRIQVLFDKIKAKGLESIEIKNIIDDDPKNDYKGDFF